jgi:diaminohydroxyphosphoribosylaminopyrimidine deaminase/5-amino-6-(5-phosphoribosylamino)uracil reductase
MNTEKHMQRCFELAAKGLGSVAPNPMVGCVITKDNQVIAEGFHVKYGEAHAEVNAINQLPSDFKFSDATLYVNLEPCAHQGKTPPCADLIINKKFKKVVVCNVDTNPLVGGKGIEKLRNAGIETVTGVLENEGRELNKRFFTFHELKRPYIILKWAQTANGFICRKPLSDIKEDNWITGEYSKKLVHQWRAQEQGIMVGTNTVVNDDPELTVRLVEGNNPVRIILDKDLKLSSDLAVFNNKARTIVFTEQNKDNSGNVTYYKINFNDKIQDSVLNHLHHEGISSVIIEGGAKLLHSVIEQNCWDEMRIFVNPELNFKNGISAPKIKLPESFELSGKDKLYQIKNPH